MKTISIEEDKAVSWRDYLELTKPRVVALMLLTAIVGMQLASPGMIPLHVLLLGTIGIALSAGAAAVINHLVDARIDAIMGRTKRRPIPTGRVSPMNALIFASILAAAGTAILIVYINVLTAILTIATLLGYAVLYTMYLKRATSQNIVIGGAAGAAPPLLGWTAVTGHLDPQSFLLVSIIFVWTPPHFWALSIARYEEYLRVKIPMLPVTHGIKYTKINIVLYSLLLFAVTLLPYVTDMSGLIYLVSAVLLDIVFLYYAICLYFSDSKKIAMKSFRYSIVYLMLLFVALLVDHFFHLNLSSFM